MDCFSSYKHRAEEGHNSNDSGRPSPLLDYIRPHQELTDRFIVQLSLTKPRCMLINTDSFYRDAYQKITHRLDHRLDHRLGRQLPSYTWMTPVCPSNRPLDGACKLLRRPLTDLAWKLNWKRNRMHFHWGREYLSHNNLE